MASAIINEQADNLYSSANTHGYIYGVQRTHTANVLLCPRLRNVFVKRNAIKNVQHVHDPISCQAAFQPPAKNVPLLVAVETDKICKQLKVVCVCVFVSVLSRYWNVHKDKLCGRDRGIHCFCSAAIETQSQYTLFVVCIVHTVYIISFL